MNVFISHATANDEFVRDLGTRLRHFEVDCWIDSRELTAGDALQPDIERAIAKADHFVVVLSVDAMNSPWVKKEIDFALTVQSGQGGSYKLIPLLLDGLKPPSLNLWFAKEPVAASVEIEPGGLDRAMPGILEALGLAHPTDKRPPTVKPENPVAELIVELTDPTLYQAEGKHRARATATLTYVPAAATGSKVESKRYRFTAPLGPIETGDLSWYLESYWRWPTGVYEERAKRIEGLLPKWGEMLYAALHHKAAEGAFAAWEGTGRGVERRITVKVDPELPAEDTPSMPPNEADTTKTPPEQEAQKAANEAASLLLSLPWELLHNGTKYLFETTHGVRVRRQLPNRTEKPSYDINPPIRVLLVSPRPEEKGVGYLDHRVSARPLVEALAPLGSLAELMMLTPPTFQALKEELRRADEANKPYHVVHFDGHGVYDPRHGLGALVFEHHEDRDVLGSRRSELVHAEEIADAVREHRVPLFFLEACQSAQSDKDPTASVAGQLLEGGVASVVAMSHSVLVETAHRFVAAFYTEALKGERVGQAMLVGQRLLKSDARRGHTFMGELRLLDWFVPVLYQEERDPQLVHEVPAEVVQEQIAKGKAARLGKLPATPTQTFVGRSRELLYAERILHKRDFVVIVGEGGEGKTTLACELARWLAAIGRVARVVFVSFEAATTADAALSELGNQLVPDYQSKAGQGKGRGWQEVERALNEQPTLIVLDNLETVLKPHAGSPGEAAFEPKILQDILTLCDTLRGVKGTWLVFTSREPLPEPFHPNQNTLTLGRLTPSDAMELVAKTLGEGERMPGTETEKASREEIERLVELVGGHARALVLIAHEVGRAKVQDVALHLDRLLQELEKQHPGERERSLLASVRLSLDRLPVEIRQRIRPLGVFQGGVWLQDIRIFLQIEDAETAQAIGQQLVGVGLAEWQEYGYLRFDPALAPALRLEMDEEAQEAARERWAETMQALAAFLYEQMFSNPQFASGLAAWELPNLLAALEHVAKSAAAEEVVNFATSIESLAHTLGRVRAVTQAERMRANAAKRLGSWGHAAFEAERAAIDRILDAGRFAEAIAASERLLQRCESAGNEAFPAAVYDTAIAYCLLGRAQQMGGAAEAALPTLQEAERRFTVLAQAGDQDAARMASVSRAERADCMRLMGRLDEAANLYEQATIEAEQQDDLRSAAVSRMNIGSVRRRQQRHADALKAYEEARKIFEHLNEPQAVAEIWHGIGNVYSDVGDSQAAEHAYQESLQLKRLLGDRAGQADSLVQLGGLYRRMERYEEAVRFNHEAADIYVELGGGVREGIARNNAAISLIVLQRYGEARRELKRAIECKAPYGHSVQPWTTFALLHNLERAVGNAAAAQAARQQAMQAYRAYRLDGGEQIGGYRRYFDAVRQALATGQEEALAAQLTPILNNPEAADSLKVLVRALLRVLSGERGFDLATDPGLDFDDAVELELMDLSPGPSPERRGESQS